MWSGSALVVAETVYGVAIILEQLSMCRVPLFFSEYLVTPTGVVAQLHYSGGP